MYRLTVDNRMINYLLNKEGLNTVKPIEYYNLNEIVAMTNEKFNQNKSVDEFLEREITQELINFAIEKGEIPIIKVSDDLVLAHEKMTIELLMYIHPKFEIEIFQQCFNMCGGSDKFFEKLGFNVVKVDSDDEEETEEGDLE